MNPYMIGAGAVAGSVGNVLASARAYKEERSAIREHNKNIDKAVDATKMDKAFNRLDGQANEAWASRMINKFGDDPNRSGAVAESYAGKSNAILKSNQELTSNIGKLYAQKLAMPKSKKWYDYAGDAITGALAGATTMQSFGGSKKATTTNSIKDPSAYTTPSKFQNLTLPTLFSSSKDNPIKFNLRNDDRIVPYY